MAFISVNLPALAGNGSGAAVDVSAFGAIKTVTVQPTGAVLGSPFVTIEVSNDNVNWAPLETFLIPGTNTFQVACNFMRATVSNYKEGAAPVVEVGGTDDGSLFLNVAVPAGNGTGADVSAATLPLFKTVQIGGAFQGVVIVEISEDGGVSWVQGFTFNAPGIQSALIAFNRVRVTRQGVPLVAPGAPVCNIGATVPTGGGGGGGGGGTVAASFLYTVTGAEPGFGTPDITIPIPARPNTAYQAIVTDAGRVDTAQAFFTAPRSGYTLNTIVVHGPTAAIGDQMNVLIVTT